MNNYKYKIINFLFKKLPKIKNVNIVELGVREGRSTKEFLKYCKKNGQFLWKNEVFSYNIYYLHLISPPLVALHGQYCSHSALPVSGFSLISWSIPGRVVYPSKLQL